jgi:hypothetical protein
VLEDIEPVHPVEIRRQLQVEQIADVNAISYLGRSALVGHATDLDALGVRTVSGEHLQHGALGYN